MPLRIGVEQFDPQRLDHVADDVVLDRERIAQVALVAVRPHVRTVGGADQLRVDPDPVAQFLHAAFQHVGHAQLLANGAYVLVSALELE